MLSGSNPECPSHGEAALVDRSWWVLPGVGTVELRGHSPTTVWFVLADRPENQMQQKLPLAQFLKKAKRA